MERRARCSCDLRSRLFADVALSLLLLRLGESLGLVPGVFGVDSLLMLHTLGGERRALHPWWSEELRALHGKRRKTEQITPGALSSAKRRPWQARRRSS